MKVSGGAGRRWESSTPISRFVFLSELSALDLSPDLCYNTREGIPAECRRIYSRREQYHGSFQFSDKTGSGRAYHPHRAEG